MSVERGRCNAGSTSATRGEETYGAVFRGVYGDVRLECGNHDWAS